MRTYVDSSVFLRVALSSPNKLPEWPQLTHIVASTLLRVESARALERLRIAENVRPERMEQHRRAIEEMMPTIELVGINESVLETAMQPFDFALKTLDAIHLATAILWRDENEPIAFATHDEQLARAAQSVGFSVIGWPA